jgi:hypothetical protein
MAESKKEDTRAVAKRAVKISGSYRELTPLQGAMEAASKLTNLLSPELSIQEIPLLHEISLRLVRVDPPVQVDNEWKSPDIYKDESNKGSVSWSLTGRMLSKIASCAGISWYPMLTGRIDDGSDPNYRNYRAAGWLIDFDGSKREIHGEKEVDFRDGSPTVAGWSEQRLRRARQHILAQAESKAKNRAIRQALAIKSSYTVEELKRPFTIPKLILDSQNHPDPEIRKLAASRIIDRALGISAQLFGPEHEPPMQVSPALTDKLGTKSPPTLRKPPEHHVVDEEDEQAGKKPDCGCPDAPAGFHVHGCPQEQPQQTEEPF